MILVTNNVKYCQALHDICNDNHKKRNRRYMQEEVKKENTATGKEATERLWVG